MARELPVRRSQHIFNTFSQKDVLFTVFGFLEYFNCSIVVLHAKSNRCLLKTTAIILHVLP